MPKKPGVYIFKNLKNEALYVGKAASLRNRVSQYFQKTQDLGPKTTTLVSQIAKVDHIETESEIEALLLEANLIKKLQPKFNIRAKDDKSYLYIRINKKDEIPQVKTTRREKLPGVSYFGPFPSTKTVRRTLRALRKIFPYCNCNLGICQRRKSCLVTDLGLDAGVCVGKISKEEYREIINHLIMFLQGKKGVLLRELGKEMKIAAKNLEYEKAAFLKKQLEGVLYLTSTFREPQAYIERPNLLEDLRLLEVTELKKALGLSTLPQRIECYDISNISGKQATGSMVTFVNAEPEKNFYRRFRIKRGEEPNDVGMLKEVLERRFKNDWPLPDLIVVDGGKPQLSTANSVVKEFGIDVPVISLAKREEEIYTVGNPVPLKLSRDSKALQLIQRLRDEAHRFAVKYHKNLRARKFLD